MDSEVILCYVKAFGEPRGRQTTIFGLITAIIASSKKKNFELIEIFKET
jgi:hypothetical protein